MQIDARSELTPAELSETGLRQFRKMLNDLNLQVGSIAFPTRRGYSNPVDLQPRLEATLAAMQLASRLSSRILIGTLGPLPDAEKPDERAVLVDALESLARHGDRLGVRLVMQSSADPQELNDFLVSLPDGTLSLDLHPAQLIAHSRSPAEFVTTVGRYIAHAHATDGVYDLASGQGVEVELGRGTADFPQLLGMLEEHGYRDWLTIQRTNSRQPIEEIGNAVSYLRSL